MPKKNQPYIYQENDSPLIVAEQNGITPQNLFNANPGGFPFVTGQQINIPVNPYQYSAPIGPQQPHIRPAEGLELEVDDVPGLAHGRRGIREVKQPRRGEVADRRHHGIHGDRGQQRLLDGAVDPVGVAGADIARHQHSLAGEERRH